MAVHICLWKKFDARGAAQGALGELTYESEAAERLRGELRAERRRHQDLERALAAAKVPRIIPEVLRSQV